MREEDAARLSPLGDVRLNVHGRYGFTTRHGQELRPLHNPATVSADG